MIVPSVLALGCRPIPPVDPGFEDEVTECDVNPHSAYDAANGTNGLAGAGLALASWADSNADYEEKLFLAVGAPTTSATGGEIRFREVSQSTGLATGSTTPHSAPGTARSFGMTAFATNIRDCHLGSGGVGWYDGCGQEVLVGAPDYTHTNRGGVHWYESNGDSTSATVPWQAGGGITPPPFSGAWEFGHAIAAPPTSPGVTPPWIAISAPGSGHVFIYTIDASTGTLTQVGTFGQYAGFGYSLAVGDFDGDDEWDLAVGAPTGHSSGNGQVFVYKGNMTYGTKFSPAPPLVLTTSLGSPSNDEFGYALAAGEFWGPDDSLAVGVPGHPVSGAADAGGFCQFVLDENTSTGADDFLVADSRCEQSPYGNADDRMGESVKVGNFYAMDDDHDTTTVEALWHEVAIGRPGAGSGVVEIWFTDLDGIRINVDPIEISDPELSADARLGQTLAQRYVQDSPWEDLAIGAPLHGDATTPTPDGLVELTRADEFVEGVDFNGTWEFEGINGFTKEVRASSNGGKTFLRLEGTTAFGLFDGEDRCTWENADEEELDTFEIPRGFVFELPEPFTPDSSGVMFYDDVSITEFILELANLNREIDMTEEPDAWAAKEAIPLAFPTADFTLTLDTTAGTLTLSMEFGTSAAVLLGLVPGLDDDCRPADIEMTVASAGVCEQ